MEREEYSTMQKCSFKPVSKVAFKTRTCFSSLLSQGKIALQPWRYIRTEWNYVSVCVLTVKNPQHIFLNPILLYTVYCSQRQTFQKKKSLKN